MSKFKLILFFLLISVLIGCSRTPTTYDSPEVMNYEKPATKIEEITSESANIKYYEAAKLNKELVTEKSLGKKARILMKIKKISGDSTTKK